MTFRIGAIIILGLLLLVYVVNHNRVDAPTIDQSTKNPTTSQETTVGVSTEFLTVSTPLPEEVVGNPVTVQGEARGTWFFEGSAPIVVTDWDGLIIGEGFISAEGEWMTEDFVPFIGTVEYELPPDVPYQTGLIILQKANPSGLPEHDAAVEIPVQFE